MINIQQIARQLRELGYDLFTDSRVAQMLDQTETRLIHRYHANTILK